MNHKPYGSYEKYFKRLLEIGCSLAGNYCFFLVVHNTDYSWSNLHERKSILYTRTTWRG